MEESIGDRIERLAKERDPKVTGKAIAEALGVSYEALRRWKRGIDEPTLDRIRAAAEWLAIPPAVVAFNVPAPPPPRRQPDAEAIADAFDALPVNTPQALDRREWLYTSLMSQIAAHAAGVASAPALAPVALPTPTPAPGR